jgi:Kdo2-lipid IVA lauroyltransferase/acyltransferase
MGSRILYYLVIKPISLLPYFVLYGISNILFVFMYVGLGYRKKVIKGNVYASFPNKTEANKKKIVKKFYLHFCDFIVESIKNFSISSKQIQKRVKFENIELLNKFYDQGKSVITIGGHYGNWEMFALAVGKVSKLKQLAIYKPLSNTYFDDKVKSSRGKFGLEMIPMKETKSYFQDENLPLRTIIFGSDQWPSKPERAYWTQFLGRETPFLLGAEIYAKQFDWPVVYCEIIREKRGRFIVKYHDLTENPTQEPNGSIIQKYVELLEKTILNDPSYWLWSHKRWKKTKKEVLDTL